MLKAAVSEAGALGQTDLSGFAAADRRHDRTIPEKCPEFWLRSRAASRTCGHEQRLKEPPPSESGFDGVFMTVWSQVFRAGRDKSKDKNGDSQSPRKSKRVVYLAFSRGEVAEAEGGGLRLPEITERA